MKYEWIVEIDDDEGFHLEEAKWKQELVRCKDCKWSVDLDGKLGCRWHGFYETGSDWYCADGERKED